MHTLAIIPARGGSKGIPGKNVKDLGGKPLIAWTIESALASRIDAVIVSTDDDAIADAAVAAGAEVPFRRPPELASDTASSLSALLHTLRWYEANRQPVDIVVYLQPTSPFRGSQRIDEAIALVADGVAASAIGVVPVVEHPYMMFEETERGVLREHVTIDGIKPMRRQDFPPVLITNAALYVTRRDYYTADISPSAPVFSWNDAAPVTMNRTESHDINDPIDLEVARALVNGGFVD